MERYNYLESLKDDIREAIGDDYTINEEDFNDRDELRERLYDDMWTDDHITGNGSGSYTFSRDEALECVNGNFNLVLLVNSEWGLDRNKWNEPEYLDVSIRCYLLGQALDEVLDELYEARDAQEVTA